jgi:hypothetical protein
MFAPSKKLSKMEKEALEMLPEIVAATKAGSYTMSDPFEVDYLLLNSLIEQNESIKNEEGEQATRATAEGIEYIDSLSAATKVGEPKPERTEKMSFAIETGIEMPKTVRGGGVGNSIYPFDKLEVGQSFFVADKTAKAMAGTVSSATQRYAKETGKMRTNRKGNEVPEMDLVREFKVRAVEGGCRIWRTK